MSLQHRREGGAHPLYNSAGLWRRRQTGGNPRHSLTWKRPPIAAVAASLAFNLGEVRLPALQPESHEAWLGFSMGATRPSGRR